MGNSSATVIKRKFMILDISEQQIWCRTCQHKHNRCRKNEPTLLYSGLIKRKVNSFAFNGNLLHLKHDCIFVQPLRLSLSHYYKQVISAQSQ